MATAGLTMLAASIAAGGALLPAGVAAQSPDTPVLAHVPWDVVEVGPGGRSLSLVYAVSLNCPAGRATASVAETAATVMVDVQQETFPDHQCVNPSQGGALATGSVTVQLAAPLGGRRIVGMRERLPVEGAGPITPRLIGLAPADAVDAARDWGLRAHLCKVGPASGLPRVVAQRPGAGQVRGSGRTVLRVKVAGRGVAARACAA